MNNHFLPPPRIIIPAILSVSAAAPLPPALPSSLSQFTNYAISNKVSGSYTMVALTVASSSSKSLNQELEDEILSICGMLLSAQQPLDSDLTALWNDNLDFLLEG